MKKNRITVAEYLAQQIAISGIPQKEIAEALNYDKANIITMFKQGKTKIPLNKIAPLARVLGIDPIHFLRLAMMEYAPETWEALESLFERRMTSDNELRILEVIRSATAEYEVTLTPEREVELAVLFGGWARSQHALGSAAIEAANTRKSGENEQKQPPPEFGLPRLAHSEE